MPKRSTIKRRTSRRGAARERTPWDEFGDKMRAPHISWDELRDRVRAREVAVICMSESGSPPALDLVMAYFNQFAATAWVDFRASSRHGSKHGWLESQFARLGHCPAAPMPGYYLFVHGELCAHHSGRIDVDHDARSIGIGALAFLLGVAADAPRLRAGGVAAAHAEAAMRVIGEFASILNEEAARASREQRSATPREAPPRRERPPTPPPSPAEEVAIAFDVLGLSKDATRGAVKSRYRALAKEWHPDRFVSDHARAGEAADRMTRINIAYAAICQARGWT